MHGKALLAVIRPSYIYVPVGHRLHLVWQGSSGGPADKESPVTGVGSQYL